MTVWSKSHIDWDGYHSQLIFVATPVCEVIHISESPHASYWWLKMTVVTRVPNCLYVWNVHRCSSVMVVRTARHSTGLGLWGVEGSPAASQRRSGWSQRLSCYQEARGCHDPAGIVKSKSVIIERVSWIKTERLLVVIARAGVTKLESVMSDQVSWNNQRVSDTNLASGFHEMVNMKLGGVMNPEGRATGWSSHRFHELKPARSTTQ